MFLFITSRTWRSANWKSVVNTATDYAASAILLSVFPGRWCHQSAHRLGAFRGRYRCGTLRRLCSSILDSLWRVWFLHFASWLLLGSLCRYWGCRCWWKSWVSFIWFYLLGGAYDFEKIQMRWRWVIMWCSRSACGGRCSGCFWCWIIVRVVSAIQDCQCRYNALAKVIYYNIAIALSLPSRHTLTVLDQL
jgi:hypothetical protein